MVNELAYASGQGADGRAFLEIAGPGGANVTGLRVVSSPPGVDVTLPSGRIPVGGFYVLADATAGGSTKALTVDADAAADADALILARPLGPPNPEVVSKRREVGDREIAQFVIGSVLVETAEESFGGGVNRAVRTKRRPGRRAAKDWRALGRRRIQGRLEGSRDVSGVGVESWLGSKA